MNQNRGSALLSIVILLVIAGVAYYVVQTIRNTTEQTVAPFTEANSSLQTQVADLMHPTPTVIPDPATYITQVQALARLETIQYSIEKVITAQIGQGTFGFLFGDKLLFVAHGTVIAGIDMGKMNAGDMQLNNGTLHVRLPASEIFIATLDNDKSYVYDRQTGALHARRYEPGDDRPAGGRTGDPQGGGGGRHPGPGAEEWGGIPFQVLHGAGISECDIRVRAGRLMYRMEIENRS